MPDGDAPRRRRWVRAGLRSAVLLLLGVALVSLAALSGEYPGDSAAGRRVALREVFPLGALGWAHLILLEAAPASMAARWWGVAAAVGDAALLASVVGVAWRGGPPLTVATLPIAGLLLVCTAGIVWRGGRTGTAMRDGSCGPV